MAATEEESIISTSNPSLKRKRNLPGNPDPEAEVIALSPKTLMATNRFLCEICGKGFQRDQNLQLHRRGHNLPWKLKQRTTKEIRKRVYVCPETTCVHNHPSRALGDLTGIKKHFCRKHGEKKWKCQKCSKRYAVQSDCKAHSKTCGTREYKCDCGTLFSRRDSFITHRAFCDALAEEAARVNAASNMTTSGINYHHMLGANPIGSGIMGQQFSSIFKPNSSTDHEAAMDQARRRFALYEGLIGNNLQELNHHQLGAMNSETVFSSAGPNYQSPWMFANKLSMENPAGLSSNTSISLAGSVPSLFSNHYEQHSHQMVASGANMSATALLQKASQIGATSSTDASFPGSFKLNSSSNSSTVTTNQIEDGSKYSDLYYSSNTQRNHSIGSDQHLENSSSDISTLNQFQMYPAKRQHTQSEESSNAAGGQTRDFLGVGMQPICHPSSINGWI